MIPVLEAQEGRDLGACARPCDSPPARPVGHRTGCPTCGTTLGNRDGLGELGPLWLRWTTATHLECTPPACAPPCTRLLDHPHAVKLVGPVVARTEQWQHAPKKLETMSPRAGRVTVRVWPCGGAVADKDMAHGGMLLFVSPSAQILAAVSDMIPSPLISERTHIHTHKR
jgi:hypothetical protein